MQHEQLHLAQYQEHEVAAAPWVPVALNQNGLIGASS